MSNLPEGFLDKLKKDTEASITHQSSSGKVTVKQISLKQQKDIISTAVDGVQGAIGFTKMVNDMILENSDKSDLLIVDKVPILLKLRKLSLGSDIDVDDEVLDIDKFIDNIKTIKKTFKETDVVENGSVTLSLRIPSLKEETKILTRCIAEISKKKADKTSDSFGVIYMYELIKYIERVKVDDDFDLDFATLKITDRIKVIENLPLSVYRKLSAFFNTISAYDAALLTADDKTITIDPAFFDAST